MPRTKKTVATEEVVATTPAVGNEAAPVEEVPAEVVGTEEPKYEDPRAGKIVLTRHQRLVLAKRRAKEKNRRKAARRNRK